MSCLIEQYRSMTASLQQIVEPYSSVLYSPLIPLGRLTGQDPSKVIILMSMVLNILLSLALTHVKSPFLRKTMNTGLGIALSFYNYGCECFLLVPFNLIAILSMLLAPRKTSHFVTICLAGFILGSYHLYLAMQNVNNYNISTLMMISFCKQMMIAINYRDGAGDSDSWLTSREKRYALKTRPSVFAYLCYMFNL